MLGRLRALSVAAGVLTSIAMAGSPSGDSLCAGAHAGVLYETTHRGAALPPGVGHRCDNGAVIDFMVVYTPAARAAAGGTPLIVAAINQAVANANQAFTNSLIDVQLRLVHTAEVAYTETGVWTTDAPRLVNPADGFLDEVHPLRDQYGADCVHLWVETLNTGGIGFYPDSTREGVGNSGFGMMRRLYADTYLLAHEIGHNLWCAHDRNGFPDIPLRDYAYGYVEPGLAWRDIMATSAGVEIPYFANPAIMWPGPNPPNPGPIGAPVGQPNPSDLALNIDETRHDVANFRATRVFGLPSVLHVDQNARAGGDGRSWTSAYNDLAAALCDAAGANGDVHEIWVAAGVYTPAGAGRHATFPLVNGVGVYGGFAGGELVRAQRDPNANLTILSGDIGAPGVAADNAYHVVTVSRNDDTAVLDGFTIMGGNADGAAEPDDGGGGVLAYGGGFARIVACRITGNTSTRFGAGVFAALGAGPTLERCEIRGNLNLGAAWPTGGGGVGLYAANATQVDCTIADNTAMFGAGVACLYDCHPTLTRCTLIDNAPPTGGGDGGGLYLYSTTGARVISSVLAGNEADSGAGVDMSFDGGTVYLDNCTVAGNTANFGSAGVSGYQANVSLTNSVLWLNRTAGAANQAAQVGATAATATLASCTVQGWNGSLGGAGNNGLAPLFVDVDGPDNTFGTTDDNPRMLPASPTVNSGQNALLPPGAVVDPDGRPRVVAGAVDRGAFEYSHLGDADFDGDVDADDVSYLSTCLSGPDIPALGGPLTPDACRVAFDADGDGDVDVVDVALLAVAFDQR